MMEHSIENGRGGCYLRLTPEQYRKLSADPPVPVGDVKRQFSSIRTISAQPIASNTSAERSLIGCNYFQESPTL
jgi:hypothetical protein